MKALTLHQPWASAIAFGYKHYETRPRKTNYRGPIAIHAGKTLNTAVMPELQSLVPWQNHITRPLSRRYAPVGDGDFVMGAIVAVAELTDCISMDEALIGSQSAVELALGHWEAGRYAYKLENIQALSTPIPIGGKQGMWNWEPGENDLVGIDIPTTP